jgi:hypothetical protein
VDVFHSYIFSLTTRKSYRIVPSTYQFRILGVTLANKVLIYSLALQVYKLFTCPNHTCLHSAPSSPSSYSPKPRTLSYRVWPDSHRARFTAHLSSPSLRIAFLNDLAASYPPFCSRSLGVLRLRDRPIARLWRMKSPSCASRGADRRVAEYESTLTRSLARHQP